MYIERNLQRGYKREELGISMLKAFKVKLNM